MAGNDRWRELSFNARALPITQRADDIPAEAQ